MSTQTTPAENATREVLDVVLTDLERFAERLSEVRSFYVANGVPVTLNFEATKGFFDSMSYGFLEFVDQRGFDMAELHFMLKGQTLEAEYVDNFLFVKYWLGQCMSDPAFVFPPPGTTSSGVQCSSLLTYSHSNVIGIPSSVNCTELVLYKWQCARELQQYANDTSRNLLEAVDEYAGVLSEIATGSDSEDINRAGLELLYNCSDLFHQTAEDLINLINRLPYDHFENLLESETATEFNDTLSMIATTMFDSSWVDAYTEIYSRGWGGVSANLHCVVDVQSRWFSTENILEDLSQSGQANLSIVEKQAENVKSSFLNANDAYQHLNGYLMETIDSFQRKLITKLNMSTLLDSETMEQLLSNLEAYKDDTGSATTTLIESFADFELAIQGVYTFAYTSGTLLLPTEGRANLSLLQYAEHLDLPRLHNHDLEDVLDLVAEIVDGQARTWDALKLEFFLKVSSLKKTLQEYIDDLKTYRDESKMDWRFIM